MQTEKQSNGEKVLMKTQSSSYSAAATVQRIQAAPEPTADNANTGGLQTPHFHHTMVSDDSLQLSLRQYYFFVFLFHPNFFFSISHLLTTTVNNWANSQIVTVNIDTYTYV